VRRLPNGQEQLFIGLHLIHEVTTPQAFDMLARAGSAWRCRSAPSHRRSHRPTLDQRRPFFDVMAEDMLSALERNCRGARDSGSWICRAGQQGIVHVIGPELGSRSRA
jgi:3-isopropylmalate/(R)-2-methylmalate dehydratase large subunit